MKTKRGYPLAVLVLLLICGSALAQGPGLGWSYYRQTTLSSATPSANFQVKVTLSTATLGNPYTHINSTGSDLRFYDNSNNACNYWIETWSNVGSSVIWVNVPTSGSTSLLMYYGNASASAVSSGASTFDFFDDFTGTSLAANWTSNSNGGSITVSGGQVTLSNTNAGTVSISSAFTPASSSFFIEAKHKEGAYNRNRFYATTVAGGGSPIGFDYGYFIYASPPAVVYWGGFSAVALTAGTDYLTRWLITDGSTYNFYTLNYASGVALDSRSTSFGSNIRYISFQVTEVAGTSTIVDWARVRKYAASEPVATVGSEVVAPPLNVSAVSLAFGNQAVATNYAAQFFNLSGANLTGFPGNITVSAPSTDFQVSNDNATWGATTTIPYISAALSATPVYVRFSPQTTTGAKSGNITFSGGGGSSTPTVAVSGTAVSSATGYFRSQASGNWSSIATWQSSPDNVNWSNATLTPDFNAAGISIQNTHTVTIAAPVTVDNVTINTGGEVDLSSAITLTINDGPGTDFDVSGIFKNNTGGTITTTGTLVFENGGKYQHNFTTIAGTIPAATWNTGSACEIIGYTTNATAPSGLGQSFNNFTWNCTGQTSAFNLAGGLTTVNGTFTITTTGTGSLAVSTSAASTINIGNFVHTAGTFYLNNGGGTNTTTMNVSGNWIKNGGTFTTDATHQSTVNFNGSSAAVIGGTVTTAFYNLTINEAATSTTVTNSSIVFSVGNNLTVTQGNLILQATNAHYTVTNDLTVSSAGTLTHSVNWDTYSKQLTVSGNIAIDGIFTYTVRSHVQMNGVNKSVRTGSNSSSAFCIFTIASTSGTISASGTLTANDNFWAAIATIGATFSTNGQAVTANGGFLNAGGTVNINGGSLTISGGFLVGTGTLGNVTMSSGTLTTDGLTIGDATVTGTFALSGGTVNLNGNLLITTNGTFTVTNSPSIYVTGNWTNNKTYTRATETVTFNGTGAQAINGTVASQSFYDVVVNKIAGQTLSVSGSTTAITTNNLTQTTGNFTAPATSNINGNLLLSAGTFTAGANTNIAGSWTNNGGSFISGSGTVTFNGASAQTITGSSATTFNNVTLNNSNGLTLSGIDATIGNVLTLTSGKITTGGNTLIMSSSSATSVSGAGVGKYINGNLRKGIANGTSVTQAFEVGDASRYTPVNLSFAGTVSGSGNLTAFSVGSNESNISTSTVNEAKNVARYWSLTNNRVAGFSSYSGIFYFLAADIVGGANTAAFIVAMDNSGWTYPTVGTKTATSTQATGLTAFGNFIVGEGGAGAPVITTHPANQAACISASTGFTAVANSVPDASVQWQVNTGSGFTNITIASPYSVATSSVSGVTTSTLTINPTTGSLNGYQYQAVCANTKSSTTSNPATLTINPFPVDVTPVAVSSVICSGSSTNIEIATSQSGVNYQLRNNTGNVNIGGVVAGTGGTIDLSTLTLTSTTVFNVLATITSTGCSTQMINTAAVTINSIPVATATPSAPSICSATAPSIALTSTVASTTFAWTVAQSATISGGSSSSGTSIAQTLTNSSNSAAGTATYTITPTGPAPTSCVGSAITATVTINPLPVATATPSAPTICSGTATGISLSSTIGSTTFGWTVAQSGTISGGSTSSGTSITQTLSNSSNSAAGTATYTVTPTGPTPTFCAGAPITSIVTVNPKPAATATPSAPSVCTGSAPSITLSGTVSGTTFGWTVVQTATISGGSAGSGTTIGQVLTNSSSTASGTATYTITPTGPAPTSCVGATTTATVTVNPVAGSNTITAAQTICSGATPAALTGSTPTGGNGTYTYLWESSTTSAITGFSAAAGTNTGQNYSPAALTQNTWFRRTVSSGACSNNVSTAILITINALPSIVSVTASPASPICASTTTTLTANGVAGVGTTTTWYTATGGGGNNLGTGNTLVAGGGQTYYAYVTSSCGSAQQSITVATETTPPNAFTVSNISLNNSPNNAGNGAGVFTMPSVTDNCAGEAAATINVLPLSSNLKLWVKADAGVVTDANGNVAEWRDLSGSGNNFGQANFTYRPVKTASSASFNNLPCITFASTTKYLTNITNLDGSTASTYTIFTVSRENGGTNSRLISSASTNWLMGYWSGAKNQLFCNNWISTSGSPTADAIPHMYEVTSNSTTAGGTTIYDYGNPLFTGTGITPNGPGVLQLNGWSNGLNEMSTGEVAEVIYYNVVLTAAQRQIVEGYLAYKYNLQVPLASMKAFQTYATGNSTINFMATDQSGNQTTGTATVTTGNYPGPVVTPSVSTVCANGSVGLTLTGMAPAGNYLNCATANDYLLVGTSTSASNIAVGSNWTIETWFKYPLPANGGWNTFVRGTSFHHIIVSQNATAIGSGGGGAVGNLGVYNGGFYPCGYNFLTSGSTPSTGWHHLTAVGSGGSTSFYIDGVYVGKSASQPTDNIVALGNFQGGSQNAGQMDEVRIWNTALPQNTISSYMTQRINYSHPNWANLVAYYRMDGNGTNSATGASACSGCNGTLQSAATVNSATSFYTYTVTDNIGGSLSPTSPNTAESFTVANPTTTGTVTVVAAANGYNSTSTSSGTITVNPIPGNNAGPNQSICSGSPGVSIGAASTSGHTYSWSPSATLSSGTVSNPTASPTVTTTYTLTESITATGCTAANTTIVTVNPVIANNTISSAQAICYGTAPAAFTGAAPTGGNGSYSYLWEKSTTSATSGFTTASGTSNTQNYSAPVLTQNTWFRRTVTSGACSSTSSAIAVTINALPVIAIATNYCGVNGSVQLTSNAFTSYLWSTGGTTQTITVDLAGIYAVTATNAAGCTASNSSTVAVELVTNGNFSAGNTGFTSTYTNNQTMPYGLGPEGLYAIGTNANSYHTMFFGTDHTTGSGNFMIINGNTSATPTTVWSENITIHANTVYYFSAYAMSLNQIPPYAQLQFRVNGVQVGTVAVLTQGAASTAGPFVWTRFYGTWNSYADTLATISIVDLQTAAGGNDFGLDDISCSTLAPLTFTIAPSGIGTAVCEGSPIGLAANLTGGSAPFTYSWSGPLSFTSSVQNPTISNSTVAMSGTYNLTVTNGYGCTANGSTNIVVGAYPLDKTPTAVASTICSGLSTSIQISSSETGVSYQLRNNSGNANIGAPLTGTGGTLSFPTGNLTSATTFNILATNTTTYCSVQMSATPTVSVAVTPVLAITNQAACTGTINLTAPAVTAGSTGGGTLSYWTTVAATTAVATPAAVTSGTYYIKSTVGSCYDIEPVVAIISATPVATFSYTGSPYCSNATTALPTFNGGGVAGIFSSTTGLVFVSTSTGQINIPASTPGTYTVSNKITPTGTCSSVTSTSTVVITAIPSATFSYTTNDLCQNATALDPLPIYSGGAGAGTFTSSFGLTFISTATGQIDISASTPGNYAVTNTRAATSGCPVVQYTSFIDVNPYSFTDSVVASVAAPAVCSGQSTSLSLFAPPYRSAVLKENFNGTINNWVATNNSTGGTPANAAWTLQANSYNYANTATTFNSNDYSQFYLVNSNAQGAGGTTATILRSPAMSTVGYTSLALDFFHFFWYSGGETAKVQVSINGFTWSDVATYTSTQGSAANFTNAAISLNAYINQPVFYIRFKYDGASNKYFWAIDNISVTGYSTNYTYYWSSSPAGYASALQNPTGVAPVVNTSYSVVATNAYGCSATARPVSVAVNPIPADSAGVDKFVCSGSGISIGALSTSGHTYSWSPATGLSNAAVPNPLATPSATTNYTLTETITSTGCSVANSVVVNVNPLPADKTISPAAGIICSGTSTEILVAGSASGVNYQLRNNANNSNIGSSVSGTGGTISLPTGNLTNPTTFNILATTASSGCFAQMTGTATVNIAVHGMWVGLFNSDWNNTSNWCSAVPDSATDVIIPQGTPYSPEITTAASCLNLDINNGNSLTISAGGHLSLYGNLVVGGVYNQPSGILELRGKSMQTIPSISADSVIINNHSGSGLGIKLTGDLIIRRNIELINGIIVTGTNTIVVLDTSTTAVTGGSDSSYMNGVLRRAVGDSGLYNFPVGDTASYQLALVHLNSNSHRVNTGIDSLTTFFTRLNGNCTTVSASNVTVNGTMLDTMLNAGYWTIHPDTTVYQGLNYDIILKEKGYSNAPSNPQKLAIVKRTDCSAYWQSLGIHDNATQSIVNNVATAVRTSLTSFSDFSLGFGGDYALPVEMVYLEAYAMSNEYIRISWGTAIEINNRGFNVMRSADGINFENIGWVDGHNNSTSTQTYLFDDKNTGPDVMYYYKLRQMDNNGASKETNIVFATIISGDLLTISDFFPNPSSGDSKLRINTSSQRKMDIRLYDMVGKLFFDQSYDLSQGQNELNFDTRFLPGALYNAIITVNDKIYAKSLVVIKN